MEWLYLIIGFIVGALVTLAVKHFTKVNDNQNYDIPQLLSEIAVLKERSGNDRQRLQSATRDISMANDKLTDTSHKLSACLTENRILKERYEQDKSAWTAMQKQMNADFKDIATGIMEEKSKAFTIQNKTNIIEVLDPLKTKISEFEKKIEQVNKENIDRSASLRQQLVQITQLNQQMTEEAKNLTNALKGNSKSQGNWGEIILENLLERSGLVKGREFEVQQSHQGSAGQRLHPDIIINLPDNKKLIIDAKVSLSSFEQYVNVDGEDEKSKFLKRHLVSIRNHIKGLSEKNYQDLYHFGGLDFVLMFMPVEPAFNLAVMEDHTLFTDAYEKNIIIVSPSTLLATLRTIANIWRQEYQNRNTVEIAKAGGELYDKFVGFTKEMTNLGDKLSMAHGAYDNAMKKLSTGRGNLVRKAEKLSELGVKSNKQQNSELLIHSNNAD